MESLLPFLQGTCTPYNMPVYPGAQCIIAESLANVGIATEISRPAIAAMGRLGSLTLGRFSLLKLLRTKETSRFSLLRASQASIGAIGAGLPRPRSTMTTSRSPSASTISRGILCSGPSSARSANP